MVKSGMFRCLILLFSRSLTWNNSWDSYTCYYLLLCDRSTWRPTHAQVFAFTLLSNALLLNPMQIILQYFLAVLPSNWTSTSGLKATKLQVIASSATSVQMESHWWQALQTAMCTSTIIIPQNSWRSWKHTKAFAVMLSTIHFFLPL